LAETEQWIAAAPDEMAYRYRGIAFVRLGRTNEAVDALDRAIALKPMVETYLFRAQIRLPEDRDLAFGDIDQALKLDTGSAAAYRVKARLLARDGNVSAAIDALDHVVNLAPDDDNALRERAEIYALGRQFDLAIQNADQARSRHPDNPLNLNASCWFRAVGDKDLMTALDLCNAALKAKPEAVDILDSRALVYLRLDRVDDAIQDYDAVLKKQPKLSSSLFGRELARRRKGAVADSQADLVAARAADPKIDSQFAVYGLLP